MVAPVVPATREVEVAVSWDHTTTLQPGQQSETQSHTYKKKVISLNDILNIKWPKTGTEKL